MDQNLINAKNPTATLLALGAALAGVQMTGGGHGASKAFVMVPDKDGGFKVEYLEQHEKPLRKAGTVAAADLSSFLTLVNRHGNDEETVVYAQLEPASFTAVINDHSYESADWRDHRVLFPLKTSPRWDTWMKACSTGITQDAFIELVQDAMGDFISPTAAEMLEIAANFTARSEVQFKSGIKRANGSVELVYNETVTGGGGREGKLAIPEVFTLKVPVFFGVDAVAYPQDVRFRYRISGGELAIRLELVLWKETVQRAFLDVLAKVRDGVEGAPVVFGSADAK